ncbi:hypothetical protein [Paractinoplanes hotanensis]|uniref:hypothetical protein n=1 Tax=Paractinoplanes hotanensis TaxID=2906497 RepID=UPI002042E543|nr:hypothetical protein [Actinoplanes hotanensis]
MVDGHPDFVDPRASGTGETADPELALLVGDGPAALTNLAGPMPMVNPRHVALIGRLARRPARTVGVNTRLG